MKKGRVWMHLDVTTTGAVYGVLTLVNANIAQSKNRSGLNWFGISIILGPLATLILALITRQVNLTDSNSCVGRALNRLHVTTFV